MTALPHLDDPQPIARDVAPVPTRPAWQRSVKRGIDILVASAALVVTGPLILAAMAAIRLTSRGPAIFRQERVGRHEVPFTILKLRTMAVDNDDSEHRAYATLLLTTTDAPDTDGAGTFKLTNDPRVTKVGAVLRRFSLDELPQLVNVLRGEMSLVGPRPSLPFEAELYSAEHRLRAAVSPGCTGLWQVSGRSRITTLEMLELDLNYARTWSIRGDLAILARTPRVLLGGDGAR
jgi:lipopolysaccharide/colanic/teichoic acid biosynthesis glycosyltransferase